MGAYNSHCLSRPAGSDINTLCDNALVLMRDIRISRGDVLLAQTNIHLSHITKLRQMYYYIMRYPVLFEASSDQLRILGVRSQLRTFLHEISRGGTNSP